ncbi:MAG: NADH-quinone oxidoreductase subunit NuoH [Verrucomicrobiae bacterium]|nr:NADH-quinone oxidoreductase subunit NuoH [Verrucomicrobiae bacterium]
MFFGEHVVAMVFLKIAVVLGVLLGMVSYTVFAERRISALIQDRIGPNRVGPAGLLQPLADSFKFLFKENVMPTHVNRVYYILAPMIALMPALLTFIVIPFGEVLGRQPMVIADLNVGVLWIFSIASLGVYGIVLAGWASNSKYPFLGGIRSSAQMISYEVSMGLSLIPVFMHVGSLNLMEIVGAQAGLFAGFLPNWLIFRPDLWLPFFIFMISTFAETNRLPFDLPESEQELVGGYHTEYGSMKFAFFFLAEYANMITASSLAVTLFLGGWQFPYENALPGWFGAQLGFLSPLLFRPIDVLHIVAFLLKMIAVLAFFIWVRWTLPRFRYDQLMHLGWKVFLPVAILNVAISALAIWLTV